MRAGVLKNIFSAPIAVMLGLVFSNVVLYAQHTYLVHSSQTQVSAYKGKSYFIPDVNKKNMHWAKGGNKFFTHQLGFVVIVDYDHFIQDNDSKKQMGNREAPPISVVQE